MKRKEMSVKEFYDWHKDNCCECKKHTYECYACKGERDHIFGFWEKPMKSGKPPCKHKEPKTPSEVSS